MAFVDPKGLHNLEGGFNDRKVLFYKTVKEIERRLRDPSMILESFIVSNTRSHVMSKQWSVKKSEMVERHILFPDEDRETYIASMLRGATGTAT